MFFKFYILITVIFVSDDPLLAEHANLFEALDGGG